MVRRLGLIVALIATLLPISALIPAGRSAVSAATQANDPVTSLVVTQPVRLAAGGYHTCAVFNGGTVKCWGRNTYGQLGNGNNTDTNTPSNTITLPAGRTATSISSGSRHTCALLDNNTVTCWGFNAEGQLGNGNNTNSNTPTTITLPAGRTATALSAGWFHTCALLDNSQITCWGPNNFGQLGNGNNTNTNTPSNTITLPAGRTATAITAGIVHTCALLDNSQITCWGRNYFGQLGNGNNTNTNTPSNTITLPAGRTATAITAGADHTCALLDNGQITCWGNNDLGQLGNGNNTNTNTPSNTITLPAGRTATAITAGIVHTCALLDNSQITCWGNNAHGQLGNGNNTNTNTPSNPVNLGTSRIPSAISAGEGHTCALLDNGQTTCWGYNAFGQLGDGTNNDSNVPSQFPLLTDITATQIPFVSPYLLTFTTSDSIYEVDPTDFTNVGTASDCTYGLEYDSFPTGRDIVVTVRCANPGTLDVRLNAYSIRTQNNTRGPSQPFVFRNGSTSPNLVITDVTPSQPDGVYPYYVQFKTNMQVNNLSNSTVTVSEANRYCTTTPDRTSAEAGETITVSINCFNYGVITPKVDINSLTGIGGVQGPVNVFTFSPHTIRSTIPVITNTTPSSAPQNPLILRFSSSVAYTNLVASDFSYTGSATGCTFTPAASAAATGVENIVVVRCNNLGTINPTLKLNSITAKYTSGPQTNFSFGSFTLANTAGSKVLDVSAGEGHTCAILTNHTLKCWGDNANGELGLGDNNRRYVPDSATVNIGTDRLAIEVVATYGITCVLLDNATTKCWGNNDFSQLGNNSNINLNVPQSSPINFGSGELVSTISVNRTHACASTMLGVIRCWGLNDRGQLGIGNRDFSRTPSAQVVKLGLGRSAKRVFTGRGFSCAILDNNTAKCWGSGTLGELGQGYSDLLSPPDEPINYGLDTNGQALWPKSLSTNENNVCALLNNNTVKCSGWNRYYQLGDGSPSYSDGDVVKNMTSALSFGDGQVAQQVSVGGEHACVLLVLNQIKCWGDGFFNIGYENRNKYPSPPNATINLGTNTSVIKVSAGFHTCAILSDSTLKCWGYNTRGAVGVSPTANPWDLSNIGDAVGEMGDSLPRVAVNPLTLTVSSPAPYQLIANPDDMILHTSSGFSSLQAQDFSYTGTAVGCSFVPSSSSSTEPSTVRVRVRCATSGTVVPSIKTSSMIDADGNMYPGARIELPAFTIASASQIIENTTTYSPTSRRFTLRLRLSEEVSAITTDDFVNTATVGAATCSYVPSSSTAIPTVDIILSVSCSTDGALDLSLRANSIIAVGGSQVPPTAQGIFSTTIRAIDPINPVQVTGGNDYSCALLSDGNAKCWGYNNSGQLGSGTITDTNTPSTPINFASGRIASTIATGDSHTCALLDNGTVTCWGYNLFGQLGNGTNTDTNTPSSPINFGNGRTATAITVGSRHTCALLDNGTVTCWGRNSFGQFGNGNNSNFNSSPGAPINFGNGRTATAITAGNLHTCALLDNGQVKCWGYDLFGQLGNGTNTDTNTPGDPIDLGTGRTAISIDSKSNHTCARLDNGQVKCWGNNSYGQLGNGTNTDTNTPGDPINLDAGRTAVSITAGAVNTCAILDNGATKCWGLNIGGNSNTYVAAPSSSVNFGDGRSASSLSAGNGHICALLDDSTVKCWGYNLSGQLGIGTNTSTLTPSEIVNFDRAKLTDTTTTQANTARPYILKFTTDQAIYGITASDFTFSGTATGCSVALAFDSYPTGEVSVPVTCESEGTIVATLNTFSVSDLYGTRLAPTQPLNFASHTYSTGPLNVSNATGLTSTKKSIVLRFKANKAFTGLDSNDFEYTGTATGCTFAPVSSAVAKGVTMTVGVSCATSGTLTPTLKSNSVSDALSVAGPASPMSFGTFAFFADDAEQRLAPISVASGYSHTCAILDNGEVKCWGRNSSGQLGNGNTTDTNTPGNAINLGNGRTAVRISTDGGFHTCAILDNGEVKCWGRNSSGQLGNGTRSDTNTPGNAINLGNGRTAVEIATGAYHTCAILDNGEVKCWGNNDSGQLGNGNTTDTNTPGNAINLGTGRTTTAITAGDNHTCAILDNGEVKCWGRNSSGQLGNGTRSDTNTPGNAINLGTGRTTTAITAGAFHTCAILDNGEVKCWGSNDSGQLGNGNTTNTNTPGTPINLGRNAKEITAGDNHTCAILDNGQITCWGANQFGQLGNGNTTNTNTLGTPINLGTGRDIVEITGGGRQSCALLDNSTVKCWGRNSSGQLGLGDYTDRGDRTGTMGDNLPYVAVSRISRIGNSSFGNNETSPFTIAVKFNSAFTGLDSGDFTYSGTAGDCRFAPASTSGASNSAVIVTVRCATAGTFSASLKALSVVDSLLISGPSTSTNLGSTNVSIGPGFVIDATSFEPSTLDFILRAKFDSAITGLSSSDFSNNYVGSDAATGCTFTPASSSIAGGLNAIIRVHCDSAGFIEPVLAANSVTDNISTGPSLPLSFGTHLLRAIGPTQVVALESGADSTCAVFNNGQGKCWGQNSSGQLGNGTTTNRGLSPSDMGSSLPFLQVDTNRLIVAIDSSDSRSTQTRFACAILDNGSVKCWGDIDFQGVVNLGGHSAVDISVGAEHFCVIVETGEIACWGYDWRGSLGTGFTPAEMQHKSITNFSNSQIVGLPQGQTAVYVKAFYESTCSLLSDSTIWCWGVNDSGQLGLGDNSDRGFPSGPINLGVSRTAIALSATRSSACAALDNGDVKCWGANNSGQLGFSPSVATSTNTPTVVASLGADFKAVEVSVQLVSSCAHTALGLVKCWGNNQFGQLGLENTEGRDSNSTLGDNLPYIDLGASAKVLQLSSSDYSTCALLSTGSVKCWGRNNQGQLGLGDTNHRGDGPNEMGDDLPTVNLLAPSVTAGSIIDQSNNVRFSLTFSDDVFGLSSDDFVNTGTAADCTFRPWSTKAKATVSTVIEATCATSGSINISLKANSVYEVNGNTGPYSSFSLPVSSVDVDPPVISVVNELTELPLTFVTRINPDEAIIGLTSSDFRISGTATDCGVQVSSSSSTRDVPIALTVKCQTSGSLVIELKANSISDTAGNSGPTTDLALPTFSVNEFVARVPVAMSAGATDSCALMSNGQVRCWGSADSNVFGASFTGVYGDSLNELGDELPTLAWSNDSLVTSFARGLYKTCATLTNGSLQCFNTDGTNELYAPIDGDSFVSVDIGQVHSCALTNSGKLRCWGFNSAGQLGVGNTSDQVGLVESLTSEPVISYATGTFHTCAILVTHELQCWGTNSSGQLGLGDTDQRLNPTTVDLGSGRTAIAVSAGSGHTCAILDDGQLKCWGANTMGQLGIGSTTRQLTPTTVDLGSGRTAIKINSRGLNTCAILDNGQLKCWGWNNNGQVGIGSNLSPITPSLVNLGTDRTAIHIAKDFRHTCAVLDNSQIKCWGLNDLAQLGIGSASDSIYVGDGLNEMGDALVAVKLASAPIAVDTTGTIASLSNPFVMTMSFDHKVTGLTWQDFSFTGSTATNCNAAPVSETVEYDTDVEIYVSCTGSGDVVMNLEAGSIIGQNGAVGPSARFTFNTITGLDVSPPRITESVTPTVLRNGGTFTFTSDKWFEGLSATDFLNTGTAQGCSFTPLVDRSEAGVPVEIAVNCTSDGTIEPEIPASSFVDFNGNPGPLPMYTFSQIRVDNTSPTATIEMPNPTPTLYPFSFTTIFSENVLGITGSDFVNAGTATGCTFTPLSTTASQGVPLSVSVTCNTSGTVTPRLAANTVADIAGNSGPLAQATGASISITIATPPTTPPPSNRLSALSALTPARILNTRSGIGVRAGRVVNQSVELQVTGAGGVPSSGVSSVSMNVTVTDTSAGDAGGYVTVYPCGALPDASNLNFVAGQTIPNAVITPVSASGKVCFYVFGGAHLIADVNGWSAPSSGFTPVTPARVLNTRGGSRVVNSTTELQVTGVGAIPASGVGAVSLNVTVTTTTAGDAGGYVTVYPCGTLPDASNLNFVAGQTIPNAVITPVSASGKVCFYVYGGAHLIADINGWYATGNGFIGVTPARVLNTRGGSRVVGTTKELQVTGVGVIPASGVGAVSLNVTVTDTTADDFGGYVTVYPCGTRPEASNLNFVSGQTIPNAVITPVSANGKVCFYVFGGAHLIADINGYYTS